MGKPKSKYSSLKEWKKDFPVHYRDAKSQDHIEELCRIFGWDLPIIKERHPRGYWTNKENCIEEAKKYDTITEWQKNSGSSYGAARKNGWFDECTEHMVILQVKKGHWNVKENCIEEAKKYDTITEWLKKSRFSYDVSKKNNWLDECTEHMVSKNVKKGHWNVKSNCIEEAKKYKTISEWSKKSNGSYESARNNGWLDECTEHMVRKRVNRGYWQIRENCIEESKKYNTISEWHKKSCASYKSSRKYDWFDECTAHMKKHRS